MLSRKASPLATKRGTNPTGTTTKPLGLPVKIVMSVGVCFLLTSILLYFKLESVNGERGQGEGIFEDDYIAGGGDGRRRQQQEKLMRRQEKKKNKKRARHKHPRIGDFGGNGGSGGGDDERQMGFNQIEQFAHYMKKQKKKRQAANILSSREEFEQHYNPTSSDYRTKIKEMVNANRYQEEPKVISSSQQEGMSYDIYHCPDTPPDGYPYTWNILDVLDNWNPDILEIPTNGIYQGLCIFDWENEHDQIVAEFYRQSAVPFIVQNFPQSWETAARWTSTTTTSGIPYLQDLIGDEQIRNEHSLNNHFMYWKTRAPMPGFIPPTNMMQQSFEEWYQQATELQQAVDSNQGDQTQKEHWYFRLNGMYENHAYLYEEMPFFDPQYGKTFTVVEPELHRGINCRFGMAGVMAEAHFDAHNNFITLLGGQRRYILAHPNQCTNMELYPQGHPSGRHSSINWSTAVKELRDSDSTRPFTKAQVNEVVLQAGDLMYLPPYWFHFIVSLNLNYQCNSRSGEGESSEYALDIDECGFGHSIQQLQKVRKAQ